MDLYSMIECYEANNKEIDEAKSFLKKLARKYKNNKHMEISKAIYAKARVYGEKYMKKHKNVKIPCSYYTQDEDSDFYGCSIGRERIPQHVSNCTFVGKHMDGKTNADVTGITFSLCDISRVPKGLTKIYPNLNMINIQMSNLRIIERSDLKEYRGFKTLFFHFNIIEYLPGDLFDDCYNLEKVSFRNNNLRFIEPDILDGLDKLTFVSFRNNTRYNLYYSEDDESINVSLDEMKMDLIEMFFTTERHFAERYLEVIIYNNQKLRGFKDELLEKVNKLDYQNDMLKKENRALKNELKKEAAKSSSNHPEKALYADINTYINNEKYKNFTIQLEAREFKVHKFLLAFRSPTLAEMLQNNPEIECLKLVDIAPDIFEIILKFLYTDEYPQKEGINFLQLFAAASCLQIEELKNFAANQIFDKINSKNALKIFILSSKVGHNELRSASYAEIKKMYPKIVFDDEWIQNTSKVVEIIGAINKKEEMLKKMDEELQNIIRS